MTHRFDGCGPRTLADILGSADRVFHATPSRNVAAIREQGIVPGTGAWGQRYETARIYLSDDTNTLYAVAGQMIEDHGVEEVSVLAVDPSLVPCAGAHEDPDWEGDVNSPHAAFYIEEPVPVRAIGRVVERLDREDFD